MTVWNPAMVRESLDAYLPAALAILRELVAINSFTGNRAGILMQAERTAAAFAPLGFQAEYITSPDPTIGPHLVLSRQGSGEKRLGLISHLDTVFPPEEEQQNDFHWRESGNRIYGPGTVDIKGGTVVALLMLMAMQEHAPAVFEQTTWVFLLNAAEERGAADFGALCRERLQGAMAALVFEGGRVIGDECVLVAARKGLAHVQVDVTGRGAHAGNAHHEGANAVVQLAQTVQSIAALTDYARGVTVNVGTISGGTVTNRVPHAASAALEMRAFDRDAFAATLEQIVAHSGPGSVGSVSGALACHVHVRALHQMPPWPRNAATDGLLEIWAAAAATLGLRIAPEERGGLSDGNWLWDALPTIDGLGPSGGNAHCSERSDDGSKDQEFALRSSFATKALLNATAVLQLLA